MQITVGEQTFEAQTIDTEREAAWRGAIIVLNRFFKNGDKPPVTMGVVPAEDGDSQVHLYVDNGQSDAGKRLTYPEQRAIFAMAGRLVDMADAGMNVASFFPVSTVDD